MKTLKDKIAISKNKDNSELSDYIDNKANCY